MSQVLVLNAGWTPVRTVSVRRAIGLLFREVARVVDPEDYRTYDFDSWADLGELFEDVEVVLSPRLRFPIPEVIVLHRYNGLPRRQPVFSRRNLFLRDRETCQYCGARPGTRELTIDHVVPRSRGGRTEWTNCVLACGRCNRRKANRLPEQVGMRLRSTPRVPPPRFEIGLLPGRRVSWEAFLRSGKSRDKVASEVYWNAEMKD
jgi:5-methylcytosine-specific restriction endonuclease McrA